MKGLKQSTLWRGGVDGYHTYRIPAIAAAPNGSLLAFCEGRVSLKDNGDIDLLVKRSTDCGETWSEQQVIWNDGPNTCGNPCVVVDESTGVVWLLLTYNLGGDSESEIVNGESVGTRTVWVASSSDNGLTWAAPVEITSSTKLPNWTWYATGPGVGIQLTRGERKGRLVVSCCHAEAGSKRFFAHVILSDDHGANWRLGGRTPEDGQNESQLVELSDGTLMLNSRNYRPGKQCRAVCFSKDGGESWHGFQDDENLIEPCCQASILRYLWPEDRNASCILFSNPACRTGRAKMTIRASIDEGISWPDSLVLYTGPSAYSCLVAMPDGRIGCLYERGESHWCGEIVFARFYGAFCDWLEGTRRSC